LLRQELAKRPLFSIYEAFSAIDKEDKGFISIENFKNILHEHGFFVTNNDV